METQLQEE